MQADLIKENYLAVQDRVAEAARLAGKSSEDVTLVAVSKTWPSEVLLAGYEAGIRHFGENRSDEIQAKRPVLRAHFGEENGITWHFIGALQSRKAKVVAESADIFHALDRLKIANKLQQSLQENERTLNVFLEVNVSGEATKSGFTCNQWETDGTQRDNLLQAAQTVHDMPNLNLVGLMTMAPWHVSETEVRDCFERTRLLRDWLETATSLSLPNLSMGMTDDFEIAIAEGATHVRVGRAIFGSRH